MGLYTEFGETDVRELVKAGLKILDFQCVNQ